MKTTGLLLLLTISLFVANSNASASTVAEFYERWRTADILESKFKLWISTPTTNSELREVYLHDYLSAFDRFFNKTDEWIFKNFMDEQVLNKVVDIVGSEYDDIKAFFSNVTTAFRRAYLQRVRVANERNDKDYVAILKVSRQRETQLNERLGAKLEQINSVEWKRQFQFDVREFLVSHGMSKTVHLDLRNFLDKKYPFRQWLVLIHDSFVHNWACGTGFPYVFSSIFPNRNVIVAQVERSIDADRKRRSLWLGRIEADKYDLFCKRRAREILQEATTECDRIKAPLFGAFAFDDKQAPPAMAASKQSMLATKTVLRGSLVLCKQYYSVVLFG